MDNLIGQSGVENSDPITLASFDGPSRNFLL